MSDPTPGANADLTVNFSQNGPDSFPNLTTDSSIQFLPRAWGINVPETQEEMLARVGGIGGTFNVLTNVGILGSRPCTGTAVIDFTMYEASVDTTRPSSALDVSDAHPGGLGYSGQFMPDLDTAQGPPSDFGTPLVPFVTLGNNQVGNEFHNGTSSRYDPRWALFSAIYRDNDGSGSTAVPGSGVTVGDTRLTPYSPHSGGPDGAYPAGSVVAPGDVEVTSLQDSLRAFTPMLAYEKHTDPNGNGLMDPGEGVYADYDNSGDVSYNDARHFTFEGQFPPTTVKPQAYLLGGVSRYPDFLAQMFPPADVGEPLARMWGAQTVAGTAVVSLNLVTFRPGQLLGFPASLGYPIVTVVLDPVAAPEMAQNNLTNVTCTPLSLVSTNFGVSHDNPETPSDEGGYVRLTNPKAEKDHVFTLVTTSDYDADDDGIENWLDTCDLTPNAPPGDDGRHLFGGPGDNEFDNYWWSYGDGLNQACDPDPNSFIRNYGAAGGILDQDLDGYTNVADNCPLTPNGYSWYTNEYKYSPPYNFFWAVGHDPVGPDNQADADQDRIGDACEGSENGPQCANDVDDDGDGVINDGCPRGGDTWAESGGQCTNAVDDDGDGLVNDGCPMVQSGGVAESGDQCLNGVDDDGDGLVNDGCPQVPFELKETGAQCENAVDDDADGKVNDGCPAVGARAESPTAQTIREFLKPDSVIASSTGWGTPQKAFDGLTNTDWCTAWSDKAPGSYIEAQFASPQDVSSLDLLNRWKSEAFTTGSITMSNGFSQDISLTNGDGTFTFPTQSGVTWVRFTGLTQNGGDACFTEFNLNLNVINVPAECGNDTDDDGDGAVNDGCPQFPATSAENWSQCQNAVDDDGDGVVNDGCPLDPVKYGERSWWGECNDAIDNDADGVVNDGCPQVFKLGVPEAQCDNNTNDDSSDDAYINDGCPAVGEAETGDQCGNLADDDGDGLINDGCPVAGSIAEADRCNDSVDDDNDGLVNDGCPAVDPGDVAKTTRTGHKHVVSVVNAVPIFKHGIKLNNLGGPQKVKDGGARTYNVDVSNLSGSDSEDVQVALRVVQGCATVNGALGQNTAVVTVAPGESGTASFTVDWTGCPAGVGPDPYVLKADACHAGDAAPAGFFGSGACPGSPDGMTDPNALDDVYMSMDVEVGTP